MSGLTQRLTHLRKQSGRKNALHNALQTGKQLAEKIQLGKTRESRTIIKSRIDENRLAKNINAEVVRPGLLLKSTTVDLATLHGCYNALSENSLEHLAHVSELNQLLFVDTETTGLSTGAGTLVFLLGAAEINGHQLHLEQILLTGVGQEKAMLEWFNEKCRHKSHLVSYNGKSFDVPLLSSRYRMQRMGSDLLLKSHIDLLHWLRRLHQRELKDCRLPSVEQHCLGFTRTDDLPGSEAPLVWQELIRFGNDSRIKPLLQHHAWDIISLAGLLHYAETLMQQDACTDFDILTTARYFARDGRPEKARRLLERNITLLPTEAKYYLSLIYRREKRWDEAVALWQTLTEINYLPAIESLAKFYEHKEKNLDRAIAATRQLLARHENLENQQRLQRLNNKLDKIANKIR